MGTTVAWIDLHATSCILTQSQSSKQWADIFKRFTSWYIFSDNAVHSDN